MSEKFVHNLPIREQVTETPPRILLGYSHYHDVVDVGATIHALCVRLRNAGMHIDPFCLTLHAPAGRLGWRDLDARWKRGDPALMHLYEELAGRLANYDVFVNGNGINIHPELIAQLPVPSIYACFDDPETSDDLSRPVAAAYELSLVGNIAELDRYRSWGVKQAAHWPIGFRLTDVDPQITEHEILEGRRDVGISMLCERHSPWRRERLDALVQAFPDGVFRGTGWPAGTLSESERIPLYRRTCVGPNLHNSTGPVNSRTFVLPANGVLLVGDNRAHLGQLFDLETEAIGFDTISECIDRCRYYLAHDRERREIAAAGWRRAWRDYDEIAVFRRLEAHARAVTQTAGNYLTPQEATIACANRLFRQPLRAWWHDRHDTVERAARRLKRRIWPRRAE